MAFGVSEALNLELVIQATDAASEVIKGIGEALKGIVDLTAGFQTEMVTIQNNTTMTTADVDQMRQAVLKLNADTGSPLNELGQAFMHVTNLTGQAAYAMDILKVANESAVSTGGDVTATANVLANIMHEYGADVSRAATETQRHAEITANAAHYMGVMHLAAAEANMTLEQFSDNGGRVFAWAANLGVPIEQASAAFATMTKHGFDAAQAATQVQDIFEHFIKPTTAVSDELTRLSNLTGVNLVADFTAAGVQTKGLTGIMADLSAAYKVAGISGASVTEETMKLLPNVRGGAAGFVLLGTGAKDYASILADLDNKQKVNTVTQDAYNRMQQTFGFQLNDVKAQFQQFAMVVGQPVMSVLQTDMKNLLDYLNTHKTEVKQWASDVGQALAGVVGVVSLAIPKAFELVGKALDGVKKKIDEIGGFFDGLGTNIHKALIGITSAIMTTWVEFEDMNARMFNSAISAFETLAKKVYQLTDHAIGLGPTARFDRLPELSPDQQKAEVDDYIAGIFGYQGKVGGYVPPHVYTPGAPPEVPPPPPGADGGNGKGNGNNGNNGGNGNTGLDLTALAAALSNARDQFSLDQLQGASHVRLVADINAIMAAMKAEGDSPIRIALEQAQDLKAIEQHTKATATHAATAAAHLATTYNLAGLFATNQQAGYGSTIAALGSPQRTEQAQTNAHLRQMLANDEQQIAELKRQNALLVQQLQAETSTARATAATAASTGQVATELASVTMYRDPRGPKALKVSR